MDFDLHRLGKALSLTDKEESGAVIPLGLWQNDDEQKGFFMVGRILSQKGFHPNALCTTLQAAFNPVKGMVFKTLPQQRFLLKFFHQIDFQRVVEGCPWAFDKNLLVLKAISAEENPMNVNLDWCDFFVHAHDLPIGKMTKPIAQFIGNQIGIFKDVDMDDTGGSWGATLRIRVSLDVTKPLLRVLKIRTPFGNEQLITFTLERLPNFCYLCGCLGHLSKFFPRRFDDDFVDPGEDTPYGAWLCATNHIARSQTSADSSYGPRRAPARPHFCSPSASGNRQGAAIFDGIPGHYPPPLNLNLPLHSPSHSINSTPLSHIQPIQPQAATTPRLLTEHSPPTSEVSSPVLPPSDARPLPTPLTHISETPLIFSSSRVSTTPLHSQKT
ncbi:hypothetical protein Salat_1366400 [Sesamum alatum]|uniref:Zinc knuckle CX2CX4HX4C domain-containing protein n=1 Tax=Sesamum alatum TaxID=300844 RepID=A0AAE1YIE0_9LAMI|nr:hypothetical protein Salat_1366400 [Sesamum alatum]